MPKIVCKEWLGCGFPIGEETFVEAGFRMRLPWSSSSFWPTQLDSINTGRFLQSHIPRPSAARPWETSGYVAAVQWRLEAPGPLLPPSSHLHISQVLRSAPPSSPHQGLPYSRHHHQRSPDCAINLGIAFSMHLPGLTTKFPVETSHRGT